MYFINDFSYNSIKPYAVTSGLGAIRFDHRYFFLYSINRYKLLYMLVNCFKIDLLISHHIF